MKNSSLRAISLVAALAAVSALGCAGRAAVRMFLSERLIETGSEQNLRKALRLAPLNATAWSQLGALLENRGDTESAAKTLQHAVDLDRYDSGALINLGLHWEIGGEPQRAEECLREAVRVNGAFYPRWVLANFYLRQGAAEAFWKAMRDAMSVRRADLTSVFQLYWRAYDDADEILQKGVLDRPDINRQYCDFLLSTGRVPAAAGVWKRIAPQLQARDLQLGLRYVEALLAQRQIEDGVAVWNRLCEAKLLPYQGLDPARGRLLTNGNFAAPPSARGFDWKVGENEGINTALLASSAGPELRIRFSGAHAEAVDLLSQLAPAAAGQVYQLTFRYSTAALPPDTGLYWSIQDALSGERLGEAPLAAAEEAWKQGNLLVRTGPHSRLIRVTFAYRRAEGTVRAQGSVSLAGVDISPAPSRFPSGQSRGAGT